MEYVKVGNVANIHGIKGEISIYPYTDDLENFCKYKIFYIGENKSKFKVEKSRIHKNMILTKLDQINDANEALKYKTFDVYINRDNLQKLDENSYYFDELIGIEVIDESTNNIVGIIKDITKYPANDVYEVICEDKNIIYLPAIHEVIKKVDIKNKKMYVRLMEGL